ncbi:MAG: hypothetical protein NVS4B10_05360 [Myxococcales bacterium]
MAEDLLRGVPIAATETLPDDALAPGEVRRFELVLEGPKPRTWNFSSARCSVGSHPSNDVVLSERTVSRFHCELLLDGGAVRVRDLESRNGTFVDGVRAVEAFLRSGSELRLGRASLRFNLSGKSIAVAASERTSLGNLVGGSPAMRRVYALLERAAQTGSTVLLEGETGTGKEGAAEVLHSAGPRRDRPLVVVDCGSIPANLVESELFGHEKGAFTGAGGRRIGAFEEADHGTIFLDEVGELPLELQPRLLRVLESREIHRLGSNTAVSVDVRVVAATHRDLRTLVNRGEFRPDLYFRLAVVRIELPPLRQRLSDIPALAAKLLEQLGVRGPVQQALLEPQFLATLARNVWPGNVRELRNFLERCAVFEQAMPLENPVPLAGDSANPGPYAAARRRSLDDFERGYLQALLARHQGKVALAAQEAGVDRVYLYRLLRRHALQQRPAGGG